MHRDSPARRRIWLAFALLAVALSTPSPAPAGEADPSVTIVAPEDTGAGEWPGTYVYTCRDFKIALWIRTHEGLPQARLRYYSFATLESFETDWNGDATYYASGQPGTFAMHLEKRSDRRLDGTWLWNIQHTDIGRKETGTFYFYRSGYGRAVVMRFEKLEREIRRGERIRVDAVPEFTWTFWKLSKRPDVLWEELPF